MDVLCLSVCRRRFDATVSPLIACWFYKSFYVPVYEALNAVQLP